MKIIILTLCMLNCISAIAMDPPTRRGSCGRGNSLMVRHKRHRSLGEKVSATLLKVDNLHECSSNIDALVSTRRPTTSNVPLESQTSPDSLTRSISRNLTEKAGEINRKNCALRTQLAFAAIKNIKAENDAAHKEYLSHLKYAEYYFRSEMSLVITKDPRSLENLVDIEFKPLKDDCAKQMASIAGQKK